MRVFVFLLVVGLALAAPEALRGQWPGEVHGVVRDAATGSPIVAAAVILADSRQTYTDSSGRFRFDGLPPGSAVILVDAPGFRRFRLAHTVANGRIDYLDVALQPNPLLLTPIVASVRPSAPANWSTHHVDRVQIKASGARTLGDAVRLLPSVTVIDRGVGSAQTLSVRGSDPDAVLVLIDGVPINDPVTGEADLSALNADAVETATLHVGASSARFGARATAGVLEVTTGSRESGWLASASTGSLSSSQLRLERSVPVGGWATGAAVSRQTIDGGFGFTLPTEVGGGDVVRRNADHALTSLDLSADHNGSTSARVRAGVERMERGLPGPGFNPSLHARQNATSARMSVALGRELGAAGLRSLAYVSHTRRGFGDDDPPAGLPYDEQSQLSDAALEIAARWDGSGVVTSTEVGTALRSQWIASDVLTLDGQMGSTVDFGTWVSSSFDPSWGGAQIHARLRLDGAGSTRLWKITHGLTLAVPVGPLALELSHRSAFSPPTLADQFFREGVGVRPNPDLRPERIPSEFEVSAHVTRARVQGGAGAYVGDVKGRIVWQPDFRFVWSPTNTDVRRRGFDIWIAGQPTTGVTVRSNYTYARSTYDRSGGADTVQLAYRPRHSGSATASFSGNSWGVDATAHYIGVRYPVPAPVNGLPGFATLDVSATRTWTRPSWSTDIVARVHRALDSHDSLIFGFPDPGRTFSLEVRFRRLQSQHKGPA